MDQDKRQQDFDGGAPEKKFKPDGEEQEQIYDDTVTLEVRLLVDESCIGALIGKGGAVINKIRADTDCRVNIMDSNREVVKRVVQCSGVAANIPNLLHLIADQIKRPEEEETSITLLVENKVVGGMIGKGGKKVSNTRQQTGTNIKISDQVLDDSSEKSVCIRGPSKAVYEALSIIVYQMLETPDRSVRLPYVPHPEFFPGYGPPPVRAPRAMRGRGGRGRGAMRRGPPRMRGPPPPEYYAPEPGYGYDAYGPDFGGYGYDAYGPPVGPPEDFGGPQQELVVPVPEKLMGGVIGRGGRSISEIRARSGATVKIAPLEAGATDRMVTVTGTPYQNEAAVAMIHRKMALEEAGGY